MSVEPHLPAPSSLNTCFAPTVLLRAQALNWLWLDVDGVLTDGRLVYGEAGEGVKLFDSKDGHGIKLLAQAGLGVAVISGRKGAPLKRRLQELGVREELCVLGVEDKLAAAMQLLPRCGADWSQIAVIGDDWPDLPLLVRAGLALAPADAHVEVRARAHHVLSCAGGRAAVREACDLLLQARGHYARLLQQALALPESTTTSTTTLP